MPRNESDLVMNCAKNLIFNYKLQNFIYSVSQKSPEIEIRLILSVNCTLNRLLWYHSIAVTQFTDNTCSFTSNRPIYDLKKA